MMQRLHFSVLSVMCEEHIMCTSLPQMLLHHCKQGTLASFETFWNSLHGGRAATSGSVFYTLPTFIEKINLLQHIIVSPRVRPTRPDRRTTRWLSEDWHLTSPSNVWAVGIQGMGVLWQWLVFNIHVQVNWTSNCIITTEQNIIQPEKQYKVT
jgi:hypothetical protein